MTNKGGAPDQHRSRWDTDELIVRIKALVRLRNDLRRNGGSTREIQERSVEIGILQTLLAREVRRQVADEPGSV